MPVASLELVFDAYVWKVDRLLEVRQIVFVRPRLDFAGVPIRSAVAIWPTAIRPLQPLLVLAPEPARGPPTDLRACVEFVSMIAVDHQLAFGSARPFEVSAECIARVVVPFAGIAITIVDVASAIAKVAHFRATARTAAQLDLRHLEPPTSSSRSHGSKS